MKDKANFLSMNGSNFPHRMLLPSLNASYIEKEHSATFDVHNHSSNTVMKNSLNP